MAREKTAETCSLALRIGEARYDLRPIAPGRGVSGWRLRKCDDGARHVVTEGPEGASCDCPDHVYRRRDYRHIRALRALGLVR